MILETMLLLNIEQNKIIYILKSQVRFILFKINLLILSPYYVLGTLLAAGKQTAKPLFTLLFHSFVTPNLLNAKIGSECKREVILNKPYGRIKIITSCYFISIVRNLFNSSLLLQFLFVLTCLLRVDITFLPDPPCS